jgi:two-component system NtrC family sensor kinase
MGSDEARGIIRRTWRVGLGVALGWTLMIWLSLHWTRSEHQYHLLSMAGVWAETTNRQYQLWSALHGLKTGLTDDVAPIVPEAALPPPSAGSTLFGPAYQSQQILAMLQQGREVRGHVTSLNPTNPENHPDAWEAQALRAFETGAKEFRAVTLLDGKEYFRLMRPLYAEKPCLNCHGDQVAGEGAVRGGISVAVPLGLLQQKGLRFTELLLAHAGLWLMGIAAIGIGGRRIAIGAARLVEANRGLRHEVETRRAAELHLQQEQAAQRALNLQLEQAQQQLLQSEKMAAVGQLAAGVAHEINNPTGYVRSNLATLQRYVADLFTLLEAYERSEADLQHNPARVQELAALKQRLELDYLKRDLVDLLRESGEGMDKVRRIVQDLKNFSHLDASEWQWADLHANIESTLNVVWNELKYRTEVVREFGALPPVFCIPSQINQVILNLLTNAVQAIPERGTITIRTGSEGAEVWFEISDTGSGIDPEHMRRLFEPFFTTKPVGEGTGLGLSISFGIVQKHGGRIEVSSTPGQGATFRVWLPVAGAGEAPVPPPH